MSEGHRPPWWRRVLPLVLSAGLMGGVLLTVDTGALRERLADLDVGWLLAAAALGPVQVMLGGWRWARVSRGLGIPLTNTDAVAEYGLSTGVNQLLPSGIAGDVLRVWRQRGEGLRQAAHAALIDRALGLGSLVVITAASLLAWPSDAGAWARGSAVVAVVLVGVVLLALPVGAVSRRLLRSDGVALVGSSMALTGTFVLGFALAGAAVGVGPGTWLWTAVPWLLLAMALPLSFAGWGVREASAALVWPWLLRPSDEGVAVAAAYGLSVLLGGLPGLLGWGLWRGRA